MNPDLPSSSLGTVLADLGPNARLAAGDDVNLSRQVHTAVIWMEPEKLPEDPDVVLICPRIGGSADLQDLIARLSTSPARVIVLSNPHNIPEQQLRSLAGDNLIVEAGGRNAADVVLSVSRSAQTPEESVSRRLSFLQRTLSQAMTEAEPISALLNRLARVCNATVALIEKGGRSVHSTGPVPLGLLFEEITRTEADSQKIEVDGWRGVAARVSGPTDEAEHFGWLVATTRRMDFPDTYATSAAHVAATLVEASQKMAVAARRQERAIQTAVLEEALALRREPHNPELAGRIAAFGLSFDEELRSIIFRPIRSSAGSRPQHDLEQLSDLLGRILHANSVGYLMTTRDRAVTVMAQCSVQNFRRLVTTAGTQLPVAHIGIGRRIRSIGTVLDSYQDAQLAVRTLRQNSRGPKVMAYEDFDYATRLFADVGFDKMIAWAQEFLRPLEGRELLIEGLESYFEHSQNINATSAALNIHHNSLRYRLAKAEEILNISLREPAAVSSLFLALTALELGQIKQRRPRSSGEARTRKPSDVEAPEVLPYTRPSYDRPGVVRSPEQ